MLRILNHRDQDMQIVMKKFRDFNTKRLCNTFRPRNKTPFARSAFIHYDCASNSHKLVSFAILSAYRAAKKKQPSILYRSLPKIISMLTTKRAVIKKVRLCMLK